MSADSIIAIVISIFALGVSVFVLLQGKKDAFQAIASSITSQKNFYLEMYSEHAKYYESDEDSKYIIEEAAANYCNTLEIACALYLNDGINKELFRDIFKDEVLSVIELKGVASFLDFKDVNGESETYENIRKVFKEFDKNE